MFANVSIWMTVSSALFCCSLTMTTSLLLKMILAKFHATVEPTIVGNG